MSNLSIRNFSIFDLVKIKSHEDFHNFLFSESINRYIDYRKSKNLGLGSVIAMCANYREAENLANFPFDKIYLTGITTPDQKFNNLIASNPQISYEKVNAECTGISSKTYDLVIVKEGIHHLARPILGIYEMLRITKDCCIIIEPADTFLGRILEKLGLTHIYEKNQENISTLDNDEGILFRDNYVFRWTPYLFNEILKSYYLNSGYKIDISLGWLKSKLNGNKNIFIRIFSVVIGRLISFVPGSRGNYMSTLIIRGNNLPEDPEKIER